MKKLGNTVKIGRGTKGSAAKPPLDRTSLLPEDTGSGPLSARELTRSMREDIKEKIRDARGGQKGRTQALKQYNTVAAGRGDRSARLPLASGSSKKASRIHTKDNTPTGKGPRLEKTQIGHRNGSVSDREADRNETFTKTSLLVSGLNKSKGSRNNTGLAQRATIAAADTAPKTKVREAANVCVRLRPLAETVSLLLA